MSISKRMRFEIFRRDHFTCFYCGRRSPSVILEVDHRIPRCAGGSDDPDNLVTACWDCNRGKGPIDPDTDDPLETFWDWCEDQEARAADNMLHDELPKWMLPRRTPRQHFSKAFDVYAVAEEMSMPFVPAFDPFSEVE